MLTQKIIYAGTPDFAVPPLAALLEAGYAVCAVYTQPDRPAGRGRKPQASPVKTLALAEQIPVYQPLSLRDPEAQATLAAHQADLLVVAAYGLILPQIVLDTPRHGCVNIHASLLPRWRGAAPIHRALLAGDQLTGITLMQMEAGLDTGPMLLKRECPILASDTAQSLHDRLAALGAQTLLDGLQHWDNLLPVPQDHAAACYAHKLEKSEAELDWQQPALQLERQVRAFNPWPVAQTTLRGLTLRIWAATALPEAHTSAAPGSLVGADKTGILVSTGAGLLRVQQLQQAGKKVLAASEFLNAHPEFARHD